MRAHRLLMAATVCSSLASPAFAEHPGHVDFRPIGGSGNNLVHPEFDAVPGAAELALAPLNFAGEDHGLVNGPNPRLISNVITGGTGANGENGQTTEPVGSAWLYVFGQFVDHDLDLEDASPTSASIDITVFPGDPTFPHGTSIAMNRDVRNPDTDTIVNTVAGYLDLSQLYGSTVEAAASLRNPDGSLKSSSGGQALPIVDGSFVTGDARVMENPELTVLTTLFMREHNQLVATLKSQFPRATGDERYEMARAITTAEYQNIVYQEYMPMLIGPVLGAYAGYDASVNAQVTQEFSTAAFRLGHSQVSDTQEGIDASGNVTFTEPLAQAFFNTPAQDMANGINPLLHAIGVDYSEATDVYVVSALRNLLFAPLASGGLDLMDLIAIDIQRERDVGLGTLNQTRQALGFGAYRSFGQLTHDPMLQNNLKAVYGTIDKVDLFIGGLAEAHAAGAMVGPTFQAIIARQFQALRAGDRFFWLNQGFDRSTAEMISQTTLATILRRNTDITDLQANVFIEAPAGAPHAAPHVAGSVVSSQDRRGRRFMGDGW
jgi:peroxidase